MTGIAESISDKCACSNSSACIERQPRQVSMGTSALPQVWLTSDRVVSSCAPNKISCVRGWIASARAASDIGMCTTLADSSVVALPVMAPAGTRAHSATALEYCSSSTPAGLKTCVCETQSYCACFQRVCTTLGLHAWGRHPTCCGARGCAAAVEVEQAQPVGLCAAAERPAAGGPGGPRGVVAGV